MENSLTQKCKGSSTIAHSLNKFELVHFSGLPSHYSEAKSGPLSQPFCLVLHQLQNPVARESGRLVLFQARRRDAPRCACGAFARTAEPTHMPVPPPHAKIEGMLAF